MRTSKLWEVLHKTRFGQPASAMPSTIDLDWSVQDAVDVVADVQTPLPAAVAVAVLPASGGAVPWISLVLMVIGLLTLGAGLAMVVSQLARRARHWRASGQVKQLTWSELGRLSKGPDAKSASEAGGLGFSRRALAAIKVVLTGTGWRRSANPFLPVRQVKARSPVRPQLKPTTQSKFGFGGPSAVAATPYWIPPHRLVTQPVGARKAEPIRLPGDVVIPG